MRVNANRRYVCECANVGSGGEKKKVYENKFEVKTEKYENINAAVPVVRERVVVEHTRETISIAERPYESDRETEL